MYIRWYDIAGHDADYASSCRLDTLRATKMSRLGTPYCGVLRERNLCQCEACCTPSVFPNFRKRDKVEANIADNLLYFVEGLEANVTDLCTHLQHANDGRMQGETYYK